MTSFAAFDHRFVAHTYNRFNLEIASGKGSVITDVEGRDYIDMGTGIAVNGLGIADEEWAAAVTAQLTKVQHTSNLYYSEPCAMLAAELCTRTGMDKVFFGNSGAEANECAIKVARKYASQKKGPGAATVVTLVNSFHGRTLATLAATGQDHFHELFTPLTPGFVSVPANDLAAMRALIERLEADPADACTDLVGTGAAGRVAMSSYRDPDAAHSLQAFRDTEAFIRDFVSSGEDLTKFIISTIGQMNPLTTPRQKGILADIRWLCGITDERRRQERQEIISMKKEDLLNWLPALRQTTHDGAVCVVGFREVLDRCGLPDMVIREL